jgi:hypothetical protein
MPNLTHPFCVAFHPNSSGIHRRAADLGRIGADNPFGLGMFNEPKCLIIWTWIGMMPFIVAVEICLALRCC